MEKQQRKLLVNNTIMMYMLSIAKLVIPLISLPYLTRVLSVECYGSVSFVKNFVTYAQIVVDFGFLLSATKDIVILIKNKGDINRAVGNTMYSQIILCLISLVVMLILCFVLDVLDGFELFALLSLVPVVLSVFLFEYVFKAYEQMGKIALRFVVMKIISLILTLCFVKSDKDVLLIPIFDIVASTIAVVMVLFQLKKLGVKCDFSFKRINEAYACLKKSFVYFLSNFMSTAFVGLNTIMVGLLLTKVDIAHWTLSMQLLTAVHALYNPIINSVYPTMIKEKSLRIIHKILLIYIPLIVLGCVVVGFWADEIVCFVFTDQYLTSATLFKYLIPVLILSFPSMLYGWPCFGAIDNPKAHNYTTLIAVMIQIMGIVLLCCFNVFSLVGLCIVKTISELVLCCSRVLFVYKNKTLFLDINTQICRKK